MSETMKLYVASLLVQANANGAVTPVIIADNARNHRNSFWAETHKDNLVVIEKGKICGGSNSRWDEKRIELGPVLPSRKRSQDHPAQGTRNHGITASPDVTHEAHPSWTSVRDTTVNSKLPSQSGRFRERKCSSPSHTRHVSPSEYRSI